MRLRCNGVNPDDHAVKSELVRFLLLLFFLYVSGVPLISIRTQYSGGNIRFYHPDDHSAKSELVRFLLLFFEVFEGAPDFH